MQRFKTIDEYLRNFPHNIQKELQKFREVILETAPEATEAIVYGMPTFKLNGKNLVHFAGWRDHIGFYPAPSGIDAFENELKNYRTGKGTLQFPLDKPIPYYLVEKVVIFRVKEILKKFKVTK